MKLKHDVVKSYLYHRTVTIPAGTPVVPATNIPGNDNFWVQEWDGLKDDPELRSWYENYGFLVGIEDIE